METSSAIPAGQTLPSNTVPKEQWAVFLDTLATTGNVTEAARTIGVTRQCAYQLKWRNESFAQEWQMAMEHRRQHLLAGIDAHIESHIENDWEPKRDNEGHIIYRRDADGDLLLDEDFEPIPVMVSTLGFTALTQGRRNLSPPEVGAVTNVAVQTNLTNESATPAKRPRLVMPNEIEDAEFEELDR